MLWVAPDDYHEFHCLAGLCRHTCCAGWEIDIDDASLARYRAMTGPLGDQLRAAIRTDDDGQAHFVLQADGRCSMLRPDGLCDIICQAGEEMLCQICADHPRFRSWLSDRVEIGFGLCCEAAARRLVTKQTPLRLVRLFEDDTPSADLTEDEAQMLDIRAGLMEAVQADGVSWSRRTEDIELALDMSLSRPVSVMQSLLPTLERLDDSWTDVLATLGQPAVFQPEAEAWDRASGRLAAYFLFRHLPGALENGLFSERIMFALAAVELLRQLAARRSHPTVIGDFADLARAFSSEIEYSDQNMEKLLRAFSHL